jgi:hypothetical protein
LAFTYHAFPSNPICLKKQKEKISRTEEDDESESDGDDM